MRVGQRLRFVLAAVLLLMSWSLASIPIAFATISSCTATVSPHIIPLSTSSNLTFTITNNDSSNSIKWARVIRPTGDYTILGASSSWGTNVDPNTVTLSGGNLAPGASMQVNINIDTAGATIGRSTWYVVVADDVDANNQTDCAGNTGTRITSSNGPVISDILVSKITSSSVVISWRTDVPATSVIKFGITPGYGKSLLSNESTDNPSLQLTGLSATTIYHYQIISKDIDGLTTVSDDNTFITASGPVFKTTIPQKISDSPAPIISLSTDYSKEAQKQPPTYKGEATAKAGVALVEYSTDGGINWLPADKVDGIGSQNVTFSFTPIIQEEGNYTVITRATDKAGNIGETSPRKLVIDRLPPMVGGFVTTLGPQVLAPGQDGLLHTITGIDQTITLSAVGGPNSISITAIKNGGSSRSSNFSLTQSPDTGLWKGIVSFGTADNYKLTAYSQDGAGNKTVKDLGNIQVSPTGKIVQKDTNTPIANATIKVYYLEPESNNWTLWDANAYGQKNLLNTDKNGNFSLFLPAGKYYLDVSAHGYRGVKTSVFTLNSPTAVLPALTMSKNHFSGLAWPNFGVQKVNPSVAAASLQPTNTEITLKDKKLLGKPTLISFGATWLPAASDQMAGLAALQTGQSKYNIVAIGVDEHHAKLLSYNSILGANVSWSDDPDGVMTASYGVQNLPAYYFFNKQGTLIYVSHLNLTRQQILDTLARLQIK